VAKIEGTLILDGLIEGRLPALPAAEDKLRAWVNFARQAGLEFNLQVDGGSFSLLANNSPLSAKKFAPDAGEVISSAVAEMLKTIPPADRGKLSSTLRSIEYRPRQEIQTLYAITPDGAVDSRQRTVEAHTQPPLPPLTTRERIRMGLYGLVAAIAVIALSAVFVDYRKLWHEIREEVTTPSADQFQIDNSTFADYFTIEKKEISSDAKSLRLLLKRTPLFPRNPTEFTSASTHPTTQPFEHRLTLDSLARGYVRCEYYDEKGNFQSFTFARIQPLRQSETMELNLPLSPNSRPKQIVITN
jgi:hypothetical protein